MAATPYAQVMEEMFSGREFAAQLQGLLRDSPEAGRVVDQILHAFSRAIDAARAAAAAEEGADVHSDVTCVGGKRKAAAGGGGDRRGSSWRRTGQSSMSIVTLKDLEDGHAWRKYGQKEIHNSKYPRAYFRCTHKYDKHCAARRQVQRCDEDPDTYKVTYIGAHTCWDPAAVALAPVLVHDTGAAEGLHAGSRLISFAPTASPSGTGASAATTSTTTTGTARPGQADHGDDAARMAGLGSGLPPLKVKGGDQEEVLSSLTPTGSSAAARNAAATPGAPDQGDVTSGLHSYNAALDMAPTMFDHEMFDLNDLIFLDHNRADYY